jgi:glucose/arabinose dehydrogenase
LWLVATLAALLAVSALAQLSSPSRTDAGAVVDVGGRFVPEIVAPGLDYPMDFAFAPDGRVFVAERGGTIKIIQGGAVLPDPFYTVVTNLEKDHGLQGIALDPDFANNGYVYMYYTPENNAADPEGPKTMQVLRVTASGDTAAAGSEYVVIGSEIGNPAQPSCEYFPEGTDCIPADQRYHIGGGLRFGGDGKLYLTTGDSATHGDPAAFRSQNPVSLAGKLIRVNPDGSAPSDNPFYNGDPNANLSKVYALGLRNPFRISIDPTSGQPLIGDVGSNLWEEVDATAPGANYGWPCREGSDMVPVWSSHPYCQAFYNAAVDTAPVHQYARGDGATIILGDFYTGTEFPSAYQGQYFYADFVRGTIHATTLGGAPTTVTYDQDIVAMQMGPDGDLYYVTFQGDLRRLTFVPQGLCIEGTPAYPRDEAGEGANSTTGSGFTWNLHEADGSNGSLTNYSVAYAPAGSQADAQSWGHLSDNFYVPGAGDYSFTATVDLDAGLYGSAGSGSSGARVRIFLLVVDATTGGLVGFTVAHDTAAGGSPLDPAIQGVHLVDESLTLDLSVPQAGSYLWSLYTLTDAHAAGDATEMAALAGWFVNVNRTDVCTG